MCGPAAVIGLGVASAGLGMFANIQRANAQAQAAQGNINLERDAAQQDQQNAAQAALARYRQIAQVQGMQRAAAAANGVSVDYGTAADQVGDTAMLGNEDVANLYRQAAATQRGHDVAIANYEGQISAAKSAKTMAIAQGMLGMGSSVLGGVTQYTNLKRQLGMPGTGAPSYLSSYTGN
jgi:hypothetical protein